MKKVFSLIIVAAILASEPLMAMEAQPASIPKELSDIGITAEDLKDVGSAVVDDPTATEADIMRHWRRRHCPRGYRLVVQRIRIGRFIITRYRCVKRRRHHWNNQTPTIQSEQINQTTMD